MRRPALTRHQLGSYLDGALPAAPEQAACDRWLAGCGHRCGSDGAGRQPVFGYSVVMLVSSMMNEVASEPSSVPANLSVMVLPL